jgi:hypothetical protein
MKRIRTDLALHRILDALEADLLAAPAAEIEAVVAETGMSARALLAEAGFVTALKTVSRLEEVGDTERTPSPARRERDAQA